MGFFHFYIAKKIIKNSNKDVFQRPERASSISTDWNVVNALKSAGCFNALNGLLPFLPKYNNWEGRQLVVSTP